MSKAADRNRSGPDEIPVIPVTGPRHAAKDFVHRVPPTSQTTKSQRHLADLAQVKLSSELLERLTHIAVEPDALASVRPERHRVESGWLYSISTRVYSPLISIAVENDRLLADAQYAADPDGRKSRPALSMPEPHREHAALVHGDAFEDLMESVDRAAVKVRNENPQEVGERLVERPLMLVAALLRMPGGQGGTEFTAVDGNSRLVSCWAKISVEQGWLDDGKSTAPTLPAPSDLMRLPLAKRRDLVRKIIKAAYRKLDEPRSSIEGRNKAAMALNALTVPVQIIVGYEDDDATLGMKRFPAAVRSLLLSMNVGVKPFGNGARNAVVAEEIVAGLYAEGHLGDLFTDPEATRDVLLGRGRVAEAMSKLRLDPSLRDLRFAFVIQQFTRKDPEFTALMRTKLQVPGAYIKYRNGPVVELALRSYSVSKEPREITSIRAALETQCLWQELVDHPWSLENLGSDEAIDTLHMRAGKGEQEALAQLGVLGMIAMVTTGHLNAPRGSAEEIVGGKTISRGPVAQIVTKLLETEAGHALLADAVKRSRAGQPLRWWDAERRELVEQPDGWRGTTFDANLRYAVRHGFDVNGDVPNPAKQEGTRLTVFQQSVVTAKERLMDLIELREENGTVEKLAWVEVEAHLKILDRMKEKLLAITEQSTLGRW